MGFNVLWTYIFMPSTFLFFLIGHLTQSASRVWTWLQHPLIGVLFLIGCVSALLVGSYAEWDGPRFWMAVICFAGALPGVFRGTSNVRVLNVLGELSYPVYLIHLIVIQALAKYLAAIIERFSDWPGTVPWMIVGAVLTSVLIVAGMAHWLLEKPTAMGMRWAADSCSTLAVRARLFLART
jgi:peptidoglycan/LPS O-acetylase OafA/YrhL